MRTDPLFYELFQVCPQIFFEIVQVTPLCPYRFESITVKATEKRIDGVLEPTIQGLPIYFAEVQAFPDTEIYWRVLRECSTYFEQRPKLKDTEWYAFVIWLDEDDDKGFKNSTIYDEQKIQRIRSAHLLDILRKLPNHSLALTVLRPLIVDNEQEIRQNISNWVEQIHQMADLSAEVEQRLLMVMTQFIEEKFKTLNYEELCKMLKLTPFEETTTFVETYQRKLQKDLQIYSIEKLIKQIKRKFKFAESTIAKLDTRLRQLTLKDLDNLFESIFDLSTLRDLNAWINARLPSPPTEPTTPQDMSI